MFHKDAGEGALPTVFSPVEIPPRSGSCPVLDCIREMFFYLPGFRAAPGCAAVRHPTLKVATTCHCRQTRMTTLDL